MTFRDNHFVFLYQARSSITLLDDVYLAAERIFIELSMNDMKTKIYIKILLVICSTDNELFRIKNIPYV